MRLKSCHSRLSPCRCVTLPVPLLESHVGGFSATNLCAFQESRTVGHVVATSHVTVRLTVDSEEQEVRAESWVTLMRIRVYKHRLVRRSISRIMQGGAGEMPDCGVSPCKGRA